MPSTSQTLSFLQRRFREVGIRPQSRHGQNFLIDLNLLRLVADAAEIGPSDVVLEVGTGAGSLTGVLAARAAAVVTVEIDPQLHLLAQEHLAEFQNVQFLQLDALAGKNRINPLVIEAIREQLSAGPERRFKLVANLPYNVATPLVSNLLAGEPIPASMAITVQKEVGDRMKAAPGTKDFGSLSVWVQSQCEVEIVRSLPPAAFWPRPKVTSSIVRMVYRPELRARIRDVPFFHRFVRQIFLHRRKHLRGVIASAFSEEIGKAGADELLERLGLESSARAEELSVEQFIQLADLARERVQSP